MFEFDSVRKTNQSLRLLSLEWGCIMDRPKLVINTERRSGADRRRFLFAVHVPERRSDVERRNRFEGEYESFFRYDSERSKTYH